jgi:hypothetical protein
VDGVMVTSGNLTVTGRTCFPSPSSTVISYCSLSLPEQAAEKDGDEQENDKMR